jgi:hypothetical protein
MLRDVDLVGHRGAVQALIEHQVGAFRDVFPRRELAGLLAVGRRLLGVVQVLPDLAFARLAIGLEQVAQFLKQVGFGAEVAEVVVAGQARFFHRDFHGFAVVTVKGIALDDRGL